MSFAHRCLTLAGSSVLLAALLASSLAGPAGAATSSSLGSELMRLTNLDRAAQGKSALAQDGTLIAFARGFNWTCPGTTMVLAGRSVDMARRDYFSHSIKSCLKSDGSVYGSLDVMKVTFHYSTNRGENIAWNKGYSTTSMVTYGVGCKQGLTGPNPGGCPGGTTSTIQSVAIAERGFMNSSGHRSNLLGSYDRFGCAGATDTDGGVYFTCVFSLGAPTSVVTDAVLPRITSETGKGGVYPKGHGRTFYATLSDNVGLRKGTVYLGGTLLKTWRFSGTVRSARVSVYVSASRMKYGYHTLAWHAYDTSGQGSTYLDGKVRFRAY